MEADNKDTVLQSINNKNKDNIIELPQEFIVLSIPSSACEVNITAKIYNNGELIKVSSTLGFDEIREAIKEARDGYIPSDAVFSITPLGEKALRELKERYRGNEYVG